MKKRSKNKIAKDNCDLLWSEIIKMLANLKCEKCGKTTYLNSHHIYSRSKLSTRWDLDNGICLCSGCHCLNNESAHKSPMEFTDWIKESRGKAWSDALRVKANAIAKNIDMDDLKQSLIEIRDDALVGLDMKDKNL